MVTAWPMTGRAEEFQYVATALRGGGVVIAGAAGVGKSRLAREAAVRAERHGRIVRTVIATGSAHSLPLGAFAHLVGRVSGDAAQLMQQAAAAVVEGPPRRRALIVVDDAHLLDDQSASLVHHLASHRLADLLITVRTGEPTPDAITAVWKDEYLDRLELQELSTSETGELLEAVLGSRVDSQCVRRMYELAEGNVLYLRHLVEGEQAAGRLRLTKGVWRWPGAPTVTSSLADLVRTRIGDLPEPVTDVIDILALAEPLETALVADLAGGGALERAESLGLVRVEMERGCGSARLAHPLYGEVRRSDLGTLRGRRLRGRIVAALESRGGRWAGDDTMRLAVLSLDTDFAPDAELLTDAAERAAEVIDFRLALRLGQAALAAGGGFRAQTVVAFAETWMGRKDAAHAELDTLSSQAHTAPELGRATIHRATFLGWIADAPEEAEALLETASEQLRGTDQEQPLLALRAMFDALRGHPANALATAEDCLAGGSSSDETVVFATCAVVAANALMGVDVDDDHVARGLRSAEKSRELSFFLVPLLAVRLLGLRLSGNLTRASEVTETCHQRLKDVVLGAEIASYLMGELELSRGHLDIALRWLREAEAGLADFGFRGGFRYANLICLTRALALTGDIRAAREASAALAELRTSTVSFLDPHALLADSAVAAAAGSITSAVQLAREAAVLAARHDQLAHEVLALQVAVGLGDHTAAPRLEDLATRVTGPRAKVAATYAGALAATDAAGLLAASAAFEEFGDELAAAEAAAQAASAFRHAGRASTAHAAAGRAARLAASCGGARTPALREGAHPLPLTSRELEVVSLAAQGFSNREIAERLVVSVRTVEGHLYRASVKVGTTDRSEFSALLGDT